MFTGIIKYVGKVAELRPAPLGRRLLIDASGWGHVPAPGDSIAVDGCCLTVAASPEEGVLAFDVIQETLDRTTLGGFAPGRRVNLEHALRADSMLDGHLVQGHIDGSGRVAGIAADDREHRVTIRGEASVMEFVTPKGSVAVNGVSLTIAAVREEAFEVAIIPTTLALTNISDFVVGDIVNLETDIVARTVVHWIKRYKGI